MYGIRIVLKEKKYEAHYLLTGNPKRDRVLDVGRSLVQHEALGVGGLSMRCETREDNR